MSDHTSRQFDAEMEAIRTGVLSMGGLVEKQLSRAISALQDEEPPDLNDVVGANEQQINQFQVDLDLGQKHLVHVDRERVALRGLRRTAGAGGGAAGGLEDILEELLCATQYSHRPFPHRYQ